MSHSSCTYLTQLKTTAAKCEYGEQSDSFIRNKIIFGLKDTHLQERLLNEKERTLEKTVEICKNSEISKKQVQELATNTSQSLVLAVSTKKKPNHGKEKTVHKQQRQDVKMIRNCRSCERTHEINKCPAFKQKCTICQKYNHLARVCRSNRNYRKQVYEIEEDQDEDLSVTSLEIANISVDSIKENTWNKEIKIQDKLVKCKVDTGAQLSVLPLTAYNSMEPKPKLQKTSIMLVAYGNKDFKIKPIGEVNLQSEWHDKKHSVKFIVVETNSGALLGLPRLLENGNY